MVWVSRGGGVQKCGSAGRGIDDSDAVTPPLGGGAPPGLECGVRCSTGFAHTILVAVGDASARSKRVDTSETGVPDRRLGRRGNLVFAWVGTGERRRPVPIVAGAAGLEALANHHLGGWRGRGVPANGGCVGKDGADSASGKAVDGGGVLA